MTRVDVAVTVMFCGERFLMVYNNSWGPFTFPMTRLRCPRSGAVVGGDRWERGGEAALRNVAECLHTTSTQEPGLLFDLADLRQSDRDGQGKHYAFQVFAYELAHPDTGQGVAAQWLTLEEFLDEDRAPISL